MVNARIATAIMCVTLTLGGCGLNQQSDEQCPSLLPGWREPADGRSGLIVMNVVAFNNARITWNRQPISISQLQTFLVRGTTMNPVPFVVLDPTNAPSCAEATKVRDIINDAADCQGEGRCGQGGDLDWKTEIGLSGPDWVE